MWGSEGALGFAAGHVFVVGVKGVLIRAVSGVHRETKSQSVKGKLRGVVLLPPAPHRMRLKYEDRETNRG